MALHFARISLSVRVRLHPEALETHVAVPPERVAEMLAEQVQAHQARARLGYYPALDFYRACTDCGVDPDLLDTIDSMAWLAAQLARQETVRKLKAVFSSVDVLSVLNDVYHLPSVRPRQLNAHSELVRHFLPDTVKITMNVSLVQRHPQADADLAGFARRMAHKWLRDSFRTVEVSQAHEIE